MTTALVAVIYGYEILYTYTYTYTYTYCDFCKVSDMLPIPFSWVI